MSGGPPINDWASGLDSQGRFWIIAGCLLLLGGYATIHLSPVDSIKETKRSQNNRPR